MARKKKQKAIKVLGTLKREQKARKTKRSLERYQLSRLHWYERNGYEVDWTEHKAVHRKVYENTHGRISDGWHIHHINHIKKDNSLANLIAVPALVHNWAHEGFTSRNYASREQLEKWIAECLKFPPHWRKLLPFYEEMGPKQIEDHLDLLLDYVKERSAKREVAPVAAMMSREEVLAQTKVWMQQREGIMELVRLGPL